MTTCDMPSGLRADYDQAIQDLVAAGMNLRPAARQVGLRLVRRRKTDTYHIAYLKVGNVHYCLTLWDGDLCQGVTAITTEDDRARLS